MSKKKHMEVQVRVLQNGYPVCNAAHPLTKNHHYTLSASLQGELALPLYPLADTIPLIHSHKGQATLTLNQPWTGFIISRGQSHELKRHQSRELSFPLTPGDYGSLFLGDLQVLIKIAPVAATWQQPRSPDRRYRGRLLDLIFQAPQEKVALGVALLLSCSIIGCLCFGLQSYKKKPQRNFEDLAGSYTLPFIGEANLATSPEALQNLLDRQNYIPSVVRYYRNVTKMIMGWPLDEPRLLFPSSRELYQGLHEQKQAAVAKLVNEQEQTNAAIASQPGARVLAIPAVYGESFQERLVRMIAKITSLHESFRLSLTYRRQSSEDFTKDPAYDWHNYLNKNAPPAPQDANTANSEIAKINIFSEKNSEETMYAEATALARKAQLLQQRHLQHSQPQDNLAASRLAPIYIPAGVGFASFLHPPTLGLDEAAMAAITAEEFGAKPPQARPQPLGGQIDPKAVSQAVYKRRFQLNLCYESALRRNQSLAGTMNWEWQIDSLGKISDISLIATTLRDRQMIDCVRRKLATWTFPAPRRGSVKVLHTFEFKPLNG